MQLMTLSFKERFRLPPCWLLPLSQLALVFVIVWVLYFDTFASVVKIWWRSDTYAHGVLIVPIFLYMVWRQRNALKSISPQSSHWGLLPLLVALLIWFVGRIADVLLVEQLSMLLLTWALFYTILGRQVVTAIAFPLAYLVFAIPFGESLIPYLTHFTALFTVKALQLTGIPVFWEGSVFVIPAGRFEVTKACSGSRYLFASLTLGALFAFLFYRSYWRRTLFIAFSLILPIVANGIRAYGIVIIAHLSNMKYATGVDHIIYGAIFFGFIMLLLFYFGNKWRDDNVRPSSSIKEAVEENSTTLSQNSRGKNYAIIGALIFMISMGPLAYSQLMFDRENISSQALIVPGIKGWERNPSVSMWNIDLAGANQSIKEEYSNSGAFVKMYIGLNLNEKLDTELISDVNEFYDARAWKVRESKSHKLFVDGKEIRVNQKILTTGNSERVLWYWYDLSGHLTHSEFIAKWYQAWFRLTGSSNGDAVIVVTTDVEASVDHAINRMNRFVVDMYPSITENLQGVRGGVEN